MKITRVDYERLKLSILDVLTIHPQCIPVMHQKKYNDNRIRWEIFHHCDITVKNDLYHYLNDENIETALKRLIAL